MNKLLVITMFVTLSLSAHGFRLPRDAEEGDLEVAEQGTLGKLNSVVKQYYETSINKAAGWLEVIKDLKLEEKAKNAYADTTTVVGTYAGIFQDQVYHLFYPQ
ncbi:apolipoprotein C-II [Esox lucius]|nr:apolipoprotein C-II [Esox lucius]